MNKWICLMFVFIVSGCGVSHEVHQTVLDKLAEKEKDHQSTREELVEANEDLATEKEDHQNTKQKLLKINASLGEAKGCLQYIKEDWIKVNNKLDSVQIQYGKTQAQLILKENEYHKVQTQLELKTEQYENAQSELAGVKSKYKKLFYAKGLTFDEYFDLGAALVKLGIEEKNVGNHREAKQLFSRATIPLEKLLGYKSFADAHYYLARAYYGIKEFKKAHIEAKKAVHLSKENHQKAQAILNNTISD